MVNIAPYTVPRVYIYHVQIVRTKKLLYACVGHVPSDEEIDALEKRVNELNKKCFLL